MSIMSKIIFKDINTIVIDMTDNKCIYCEKFFSNKYNLLHHQFIHHHPNLRHNYHLYNINLAE